MKTRRSAKRSGISAASSVKASASIDDVREQILDFIGSYVSERGFPPSLREIGKEVDRSPQAIMLHLDRLEADGYLTRMPRIPRSLRLSPGGRKW